MAMDKFEIYRVHHRQFSRTDGWVTLPLKRKVRPGGDIHLDGRGSPKGEVLSWDPRLMTVKARFIKSEVLEYWFGDDAP